MRNAPRQTIHTGKRPRCTWAGVALAALLGLAGCGDNDGVRGTPGSTPDRDAFGGWRAVRTAATGRFRVEQIDGTWWFVTPEGNAFLSLGVNFIVSSGDFSPPLGRAPYHDNIVARHGSAERWAEETLRRLRTWGFTSAGAWSESRWFRGRLPYVEILSFESAAPDVQWPAGIVPRRISDFFAPEFAAGVSAVAEQARTCSTDPYCIGVFVGNEMAWGHGLQQRGTYLDVYMNQPAAAAGKHAVVDFFRRRYAGDIDAFNAVWPLNLSRFEDLFGRTTLPRNRLTAAQRDDHRAFMGAVARRFFSLTHDALRAVAPDLLILGSRFFSFQTLPEVYAAAAPFVDVISLNNYDASADLRGLVTDVLDGGEWGYPFLDGPFSDLAGIAALTQRPLLITEYFYRVSRPGISSLPAGLPEVPTREAQADAFARYAGRVLAEPAVIGAHWFQYFDQPVTGRPDGENQIIGLVDIEDEPYPLLTSRMTAMNARSYGIHATHFPE